MLLPLSSTLRPGHYSGSNSNGFVSGEPPSRWSPLADGGYLQAYLPAKATASQIHRSRSAQPSMHLTERHSSGLPMLFLVGAVAGSVMSLCSDQDVVMQLPGAQTTQWYLDKRTEPPQRRHNLTMAPFSLVAREVEGAMVRCVPGGAEPSVPEIESAVFGITYMLPEVLRNHMEAGARNFVVVDLWSFDYTGGHIQEGSLQVPSVGVVARTNQVVGLLAAYSIVIFHCMVSMHRAPQCAQIYKRRLMELGR